MNSRNHIRLAIIRQKYTAFGGAERFVENAIQGLSKYHSIETTLITRKWPLKTNTKKIIELCNPFYVTRALRDWSFSRCACAKVRAGNYDLVQSNERAPCGDIYRAGDGVHREWLEKWKPILPFWRKIWLNASLYHAYLRFMERRVFSSPSLKAIIANSYSTKKEIEKHFPEIEAEIHVVRNGVDTKYYHPSARDRFRSKIRKEIGIKKNERILLFVGSGFERKGVPLLLNLLKDLPGHALVIVGKDSRIKRYKKTSARLGLGDRCYFTGPQHDTLPWYATADIFVFPTLYDPLPNTALEAMSCGLPTIISKDSGAAELIKNGENGYSLDPHDLRAWRTSILSLDSQEKIDAMGNAARRSVEHLTLENASNELMRIYQKLLS